MSFSRAPLKRFNDTVGCAPPPGSYEIKPEDLKGPASFEKSDRFRNAKAGAMPPLPSPSRSVLASPVRRTMSVDVLVEGYSSKKEKGMTPAQKQQKLLEKEIRSLVQQRGEQDRRLLALEEEFKKVEAKLLAAVREKTSSVSTATTLERQCVELKKINDFLKSKVSADMTKKRINSLTMELMEARNTLDVKNKEIKVQQINSEARLKALETDLESMRTTVTALKGRNKELDDLNQVSQTQNKEMENAQTKIQELREELKAMQGYLDTANDRIQELQLNLREKAKESRSTVSQVEKLKQLQSELEGRIAELQSAQEALRQKEEEALERSRELQAIKDASAEVENKLEDKESQLRSSRAQMSDMEEQLELVEQQAEDLQTTTRQQELELARLREVLRRTEKELDERVAHLEQRCLFSEEERSKTQEEGLMRVEELKAELTTLKEVTREDKKSQTELTQQVSDLSEELTKEKALVKSLCVLLEQEREEYQEHQRRVRQEIEEVLGEQGLLEDMVQRGPGVATGSPEALQKLLEEYKELEIQLGDTRAQLESKSSDVVSLKDEHLAAMEEVKEAHANALSQATALAAELESAKEALTGAEGRREALEADLARTRLHMAEETRKALQEKQEEIKRLNEELKEHQERRSAEAPVKEETSRLLLEVQSCLAKKEQQMKAMEATTTRLQQQITEKEDALGRRADETAQIKDRLRNEEERFRTLLSEVKEEKDKIIEQLQQEKEKVRAETVMSLHSQIELKDEARLAAESRLSSAEEDRSQLQCRLDEVEQRDSSLCAQLDLLTERTEDLLRELEEHQQDGLALQEQVQVLTQEKVTLQWEVEEQRQELQRKVSEAQEKNSHNAETGHWRKQYEELFSKVKPFQEQLNAFAAERNALLNENGASQDELNKLSNAYAHLLGHQNQKQKIKHVMKLKDENNALKQEISQLRSLVNRQKSDLDQLKSKLPGASCRRFDPSKAFQHNKENKENKENEANEALREGNFLA
ncbi:hyaluronan mediated motility receptor isoform X2 [Nelusetta ayraudi]|uniref:hyaluronan mediated motility receptor isoform X2 n=1 Tax=Nelusetta ayraudi TaxID=303726 RepID=UPI003F72666D